VLGAYTHALASLREELKSDPQCSKAKVAIGDCYMRLGQHHNAVQWYEQAMVEETQARLKHNLECEYHANSELSALTACSYVGYAVSLFKLGMVKEGVHQFQMALQLPENTDKDVHVWTSTRREAWGNQADALNLFQQFLTINPLHIQVHLEWAQILQEEASDRTTEAASHMDEAKKLQNKYAQVCEDLGTVLQTMKRPEEARGWIDKADRIRRRRSFFATRL